MSFVRTLPILSCLVVACYPSVDRPVVVVIQDAPPLEVHTSVAVETETLDPATVIEDALPAPLPPRELPEDAVVGDANEAVAEGGLFGGGDDATGDPSEWLWFDDTWFDEPMRCMDGSSTGVAMRFAEDPAAPLLIYMQGGGACFDFETCAVAGVLLNNEHMNASDFTSWALAYGGAGVFNKDHAQNPFADHHVAFIPYCSGDVHAGDNPNGPGGRFHVGARNTQSAIDLINLLFFDAPSVTVSGTSAGGFGAAWNFWRFRDAFEGTEMHLVIDSAPPLDNEAIEPCLQSRWDDAWHLSQSAAPFWTGALGDPDVPAFDQLLLDTAREYPDVDIRFVHSNRDGVLRFFFGIGKSWGCTLPWVMRASTYRAATDRFNAQFASEENIEIFLLDSKDHEWMTRDERMFDTPGLSAFLADLLE